MRKSKVLIALTAFVMAVGMCLTGCNGLGPGFGTVQYGSLTVGDDSSRGFYTGDIKSAVVTVTGYDINGEKFTKTSEAAAVSGGISNGITVKNIPHSKNVAVMVQAYSDAAGTKKVNGVTIYNVASIQAASNSISVNQETSKKGCVYAQLVAAGVNTNALSAEQISNIQAAIPDVKYSLIKANSIAADYKSGNLKASSEYIVTPATVNVTPKDVAGYTVQISDQVSDVKTMGTTSVDYSVAPGSWTIYAIDSEGEVKASKGITVSAAGSSKVTVEKKADTDEVVITIGDVPTPPADGITVHTKASSYGAIYVWDSGTSIDKTGPLAMTADGDWNVYTISANSAKIIFTPSAGSWAGQTSNLAITEAGEYWYLDGKFYTYNPEDQVSPVLVSFTADKSGTVSGDVTFTVSATDDKKLTKAVLTLDEKTLATVALDGTSATESYVWDTSRIQNGTHSIGCTVYDGADNTDSASSISLTTNNVNLPPVAVISGAKKPKTNSDVTYKATSSYDQNGGTIASYKWTVSGSGATIKSGSSSEALVVTTSGSEGATFTVSLVVTDNEGASSEKVSLSCETVDVDPNWDYRDETVYFLMTTRFYDGDSGNNLYCWDEGGEYLPYGAGDCAWRGDFKGLIEKLDYIKALGFTTIWITPVVVNASGIDYHGYHAFDFSHVDPRYASGSAKYDANGDDISGDEAYQELIDAVHSKGMKIMQDIVLNHTGNWGEKNLNNMFYKGDAYTDSLGYKRAAPMIGNNESSVLQSALGVYGYSTYEAAQAAGAQGIQHDGNVAEYAVRLKALKGNGVDPDLYHHEAQCEYNGITYVMGSMAGDCVDLNTENPAVQDYLIQCYSKYIGMGVDAFRIDTTKHITRGVFNKVFNPALHEAAAACGNDKFYMTGEVCARWNGRWSDNDIAQGTPSFYTWKDSTEDSYYRMNEANWKTEYHNAKTSYPYVFWDAHSNSAWESILNSLKPSVPNHKLNGNNYHDPDYSNYSGLNTIDFKMHWQFKETYNAFAAAKSFDDDICDASWNLVYVDSHDYAPDQAPENQRFTGNWPDKLNLIFTFRGIPCIYYGSEIEFMKGAPIDPANARCQLNKSGRAYFGDHLEGTVSATDFGEYTASGTVATTLGNDLAQHIIRLNKIRAAIPALRKGQYSTDGCNGGISFKRRYTKDGVDSFALVTINGQAVFTGILNGTYVEVVTGKTVNVTNGSLTSDSIGTDNMRVYVLQTGDGVEPTGKIGSDGAYLK